MAEPSQLKNEWELRFKVGACRKLRLEGPTNNSDICYWS